MEKIKFYSEQDFMCGNNLNLIVKVVDDYYEVLEPNINRIIELYNILKYLGIDRFKKYIQEKTSTDITGFVNTIKTQIGKFINSNKKTFLEFYISVDFPYKKDYFEILEIYKVFTEISKKDMLDFLTKEKTTLHHVLRCKNLVYYYDEIVKDRILEEPNYAELVLDKYLSKEILFLPSSLKDYEIEKLMDRYLNLESLSINQLRKIIYLPSNIELKISDSLRLKAKKKLKEEEEKFFKGNIGIEMGATITYVEVQDEVVISTNAGAILSYSIHKKWITDNLDFNTLLNNFIHIFEFFDHQCRLRLVAKKNEVGVFERIASTFGDHLYEKHSIFRLNEMISTVQLVSYSKFLSLYGIRFENMIEWFFKTYLQEEFGINDFVVKMPSDSLSFLEKCRTIAPEVDRILKQYNIYVQDSKIDHELLQMSSKPLVFSDCTSMIEKKHVYPKSEYYSTATYNLFSDQSGLAYLSKFNDKHSSLAELIQKEQVQLSDFVQYQKKGIQWLIDNGLLTVDDSGFLVFDDKLEIIILRDLFVNEVISYWRQSLQYRRKLDELIHSGVLISESSLFSKKEQDYLDFFLNRSKFTNGYDLRNRYVHGTHSNEEQEHEKDYYSFLKIIIILVIKINDDLCIFKNK